MKKIVLFVLFILLLEANCYAVEYSLEDLYRIALERSERIKISEEDLLIAEITKDRARSVLIPKFSAFGSYTRFSEGKYLPGGMSIQPEGSASWGLRLEQSFSLSGRELTVLKIAETSIDKSRHNLQAIRELYMINVASAYYEVLRSQKKVEIAKTSLERLQKPRDAAAIRLKVGEVTKTALLRAEAELSGAKSELIRAENTLALARAVLARIVGISPNYRLKDNSEDYKPAGFESLESLRMTAIRERPEIKSITMQKTLAEKQVRYTRGAFFPSVSIEGVYSRREDTPTSDRLNKESVYAGARVNIPIFDGGLRKADVREAEARLRQSKLIYADTEDSILTEVENAYFEFMTQKGVIESLIVQAAFAADNYRAVSRQFELGLANSIDVMDANTLLATSERQLADANYNYRLAELKVKTSAGILIKTISAAREPRTTDK